jgi:hypothetical protein
MREEQKGVRINENYQVIDELYPSKLGWFYQTKYIYMIGSVKAQEIKGVQSSLRETSLYART